MQEMSVDKNLFKKFGKYASLNMLGMLGVSCYILADTFFIANGVGAEGIAALNLVIPVIQIMNGLGLMIGMGAATRFSLTKATEREEVVNARATVALGLSVLLSLFFVATGLFFARPLSGFLGAEGDILDLAESYMRIITLFAPFFMLNFFIQCFVRNDRDPGLAMRGMVIGSLSNIVLDYIFIYPFGWGMEGAAIATVISPIVSLAVMSLHFTSGKNQFAFVNWTQLRRKLSSSCIREEMGTVMTLGLPTFFSELSLGIIVLVFNYLLLSVSGTVAVSAYAIIANLSIVVTALFNGLAQGAQPLISFAYGEGGLEESGEPRDVRRLFRYGIVSSLVMAVVMYTGIVVFREPIAALFNNENNAELTRIAVQGLVLYFAAYPFIGLNIFISNSLSAINKPVQAFIITLLRGILLVIPVTLVLSYFFDMTGIWLSAPVFEALTAVVAVVFWKKRHSGKKILVKRG